MDCVFLLCTPTMCQLLVCNCGLSFLQVNICGSLQVYMVYVSESVPEPVSIKRLVLIYYSYLTAMINDKNLFRFYYFLFI